MNTEYGTQNSEYEMAQEKPRLRRGFSIILRFRVLYSVFFSLYISL
jgi:hypothetical protein